MYSNIQPQEGALVCHLYLSADCLAHGGSIGFSSHTVLILGYLTSSFEWNLPETESLQPGQISNISLKCSWLWYLSFWNRICNISVMVSFTFVEWGKVVPDSMDSEVIQLDVLNNLIQKSVSHGVKICKRVCLEKTRWRNVNRMI